MDIAAQLTGIRDCILYVEELMSAWTAFIAALRSMALISLGIPVSSPVFRPVNSPLFRPVNSPSLPPVF